MRGGEAVGQGVWTMAHGQIRFWNGRRIGPAVYLQRWKRKAIHGVCQGHWRTADGREKDRAINYVEKDIRTVRMRKVIIDDSVTFNGCNIYKDKGGIHNENGFIYALSVFHWLSTAKAQL